LAPALLKKCSLNCLIQNSKSSGAGKFLGPLANLTNSAIFTRWRRAKKGGQKSQGAAYQNQPTYPTMHFTEKFKENKPPETP
jgi:hypothetical protein